MVAIHQGCTDVLKTERLLSVCVAILLLVNVGNSVRYALDCLGRREHEAAMMHACAAVSSTAKQAMPRKHTDRQAFTGFLRQNYDIFGLMAVRGINIHETRFPVAITSSLGENHKPDIADLIYKFHRNTHAHGDEVPLGFELVDDPAGPVSFFYIDIDKGNVQLPWNTIVGLCAVAIVNPVNVTQRVPDGYWLSWGWPVIRFEINEWWGRTQDFRDQLASQFTPQVKLDFGEYVDNPPQSPGSTQG